MRRSFIIIIVTVLGFSTCVSQTSACMDDCDIEVAFISGSYHDLDLDGSVDDIKTVFKLEAHDDNSITQVYTRLILPSGTMFDLYIILTVEFDEAIITIGWFNCLRESGWYFSEVFAESYGAGGSSSGYDWILFDPPTEGIPGGPSIDVLSIEISE